MEHGYNEDLLLKHLKRGDEKAFLSVYEVYHNELQKAAFKYLHNNRSQVEDVVQDTFLRLWVNKNKIKTSLREYMFTILRNRALDLIRKQKRKHRKNNEFTNWKKTEQLATSERVIDRSVFKKQKYLLEAVDQLPEKRQEIFKLRTIAGLTNKEIAEYLNISIHTVKSQYWKATESIREYCSNI
jgi:RNA polymerase sigma-70 factor (ECF subfamily)